MDPRIHEIIDNSQYCRATLNQVAELLPDDDGELDQWLEVAIRKHDTNGFVYLIFAALHRERRVSSRFLEDGLSMFPHIDSVCALAWHVEGDDVPERLLAGTKKIALFSPIHAAALLAAAEWCKERREGILPPELITEARVLARTKDLPNPARGLLIALALSVGDTRIPAILYPKVNQQHPGWGKAIESAEDVRNGLITRGRRPIIEMVPETPKTDLKGFTVRRSVEHIGRNEPCHCGSGTKYKRCCFENDQKRLKMSSDVAGKTFAEVMVEPEPHMNEKRLEKCSGHELARIDPAKLDPDLQILYFVQLCAFQMLDEAAASMENLGCPEELRDVWFFVLWTAARSGRKDIAERLIAVRSDDPLSDEELPPSVRLLLVRDDPAAFLHTLNEMALDAMKTTDSETLQKLAYGVLLSPVKGIGMLISRAMIPLVEKREAVFLLDEMLIAREKLNLSPDEPASDWLDKRFANEAIASGAKETEALREARRKLEAKADEVRRMQSSLEQLRAEISRREKPQPAKPAESAPAAPVDAEVLRDLRQKVTTLKSALKERHAERATLRRDLSQTLTELETLREKQPKAPAHSQPATDSEDHLLLPGEIEGNQPVRILELPRKFHHTLHHLPRQVARGAMVLLGRLAAGEPDAFTGVVRLKQRPDTLRARIGIDHRLLFRLETEAVHVIDLIPRQDLERRIKTL